MLVTLNRMPMTDFQLTSSKPNKDFAIVDTSFLYRVVVQDGARNALPVDFSKKGISLFNLIFFIHTFDINSFGATEEKRKNLLKQK